ncbi:sugar-binding transcriptional regulator [Pseudooceanicola sp. 200-1SW]|uniref:sugar-binding transcriptional regulator n=1 Tax=Pseudooceanicola sp. 200-1SW TaxID=3425949 RepID=UPI003D7F2AFB
MAAGHGDEGERARDDDAARAAWLYYRGGMRQDRIAQEMGISRQRVQRLVARAVQEGLIRVRIEHPIAACEEMQLALCERYGIGIARVAPGLGGAGDPIRAIAPIAAQLLERMLAEETPQVIGLGCGRSMRAMADEVMSMDGARHRLVSLIGNVAPDGSAGFHEALMRVSERTGAAPHLLPVPLLVREEAEVTQYQAMPHVRQARTLAKAANAAIVGVGVVVTPPPLIGSLSPEELEGLRAAGGVGELCGHVFDAEGRYLDHPINNRMLSMRLPLGQTGAIGLAAGPEKVAPLRAALRGGLLQGLITDEETAAALLKD